MQKGKRHDGVLNNDCLFNHHLFINRDKRFVTLLCRDVEVMVFKPGEDIVKEGSKGNSMYILRRGEVEILSRGQAVTRLGSGSVFGEILMLGVSDRRTATVRATEFSDCRVVSRKCLQRLLRVFPREKIYFEQVARTRMMETKVAAPPERRQPAPKLEPHVFCRAASMTSVASLSAVAAGSEDGEGLPPLEDEGAAQRATDCAVPLSSFSRFFSEKSNWRTGYETLKKSSPRPAESPRKMEPSKDHPQLPALIITRSTRSEWAGEQPDSDPDAVGDPFFMDSIGGIGFTAQPASPTKSGNGRGPPAIKSPASLSPRRSPSPGDGSLSPRSPCSPYAAKARRPDGRGRQANSCSPRLDPSNTRRGMAGSCSPRQRPHDLLSPVSVG